jgi:hypothetical protein
MKIGFSFGRCVRDIVKGHVKIEDVMCIIARTYMPKEEHVLEVIRHYMYTPHYLSGLDQVECERVGLELFRTGRVLEPRQNGVNVMQAPRDGVWMDLYPTVIDSENESVRQSWEAYRMLIGLTEQLPEPNEEVLMHRDKNQDFDAANRKIKTAEELEADRRAIEILLNSI